MKNNFKIKPHQAALLSSPTPRCYKDTNLYYEERMERTFPTLALPSFLSKPKIKWRERARRIFESLLVLAHKKLNGAN